MTVKRFIVKCPICGRLLSRKKGWVKFPLSEKEYRKFLKEFESKENNAVIETLCPKCRENKETSIKQSKIFRKLQKIFLRKSI